MTSRHLEILQILISDYIANAQPVGSRTIAKRHPAHLSSATVRNVMADLTEMGLLKQPHISAGRVPTGQGMRLYVDTLLRRRELSEKEMETIRENCVGDERRIDAVLKRTSRMLALVSRYAGIVVMPDARKMHFKHIEFLPLSKGRILGIFVSQDGVVQNRLIEVGEEFSQPEIERINNYCNASFLGLSLDEALEKARRELEAERADYDRLLKRAMLLSEELLGCIPPEDLLMEGELQLLSEPEFAEVHAFQQVIGAIEEKQAIFRLLERCRESEGVRIFLGSDADLQGMDAMGLVGAPYMLDGKVIGSLGVIGPMRMDYARVVPIVDFTAKILSDMMEA